MSGTDVVFNYRPKKNGKSIERFLFLNGTRTNNGAEIRAGRIYQNDKEVANVDGSQYDKQQIAGAYSGNGGKQPPSYVGSGKVRFLMSNVSNNGNYDYKDYMYMDTYVGSDVPVVTAFGITKSNNLKAFIMSGPKGGSYWAREAELWTTLNFDPNNKISISSISTSINDSAQTNVASAYLTNWLYERKKVKTAWSGKYLSTQGSQSVLCTLPSDWELCIIQYQWGSADDLGNHYCTAIITKYMKGISYHAPGSGQWGEARFRINSNNQFIPEGWHTEGNDCYILRVDYIL